MKLSLSLVLLGLTMGTAAFASNYNCSVINIAQGGPKLVGTLKVTPQTGTLQKIEIDSAHDVAACGGSQNGQGAPTQLVCFFSDASSDVKLGRSVMKGQVTVLKRNRVTGQVSVSPVAATEDGAQSLTLAMPVGEAIYATVCNQAQLNQMGPRRVY